MQRKTNDFFLKVEINFEIAVYFSKFVPLVFYMVFGTFMKYKSDASSQNITSKQRKVNE